MKNLLTLSALWRPRHVLRAMLLIAFAALLSAPCVHAGIIVTGDIDVTVNIENTLGIDFSNPLLWVSSPDYQITLKIGNTADGSVTLDDGSTKFVKTTYLGSETGSAGTLTLQGEGTSWESTSDVRVGNHGTGTLKITNGASMSSGIGYIGRYASGTVIVDGEGSTWTMDHGYFYVGRSGTGTLKITNGASVLNVVGQIGQKSGSSGTVIVDGEGSTWTNTQDLRVGCSGTGTVSISDGGAASAGAVSINDSSILTTDLGYGSSLTVGSGSGDITNNGTLRLVAGAGAASGTYTPMSYGTLLGNDAQVLGGVWDSDNHTVTVNDAELALAGRAKTIDLATTQRLLFVDAPTGRIAGASFMASDSPLKFTASVMGESEVSALESILGPSETVLSAWDFLAWGGYAEGDPVYLSLEIGSGYDLSDLAIWLFDESTWSEFLASDLAYDNTYASFTVTDFSGYAVTGTSSVPIPGAVWLLGSGLLSLIGIRRKRH